MIKSGKRVKPQRYYSEEFKLKMIGCYESGEHTVLELCSLYSLQESTLYRWIYKYSTYNKQNIRIVEMKDSHHNKLKELSRKVEHLEQVVGRKQLTIDFLEEMIRLASEHYGIEIKKNYSTPPSGDSKISDQN